jgi:hypothetical protein
MADTEEEAQKGRCVSCGFLATYGDRWHEVSNRERRSGRFIVQDGMQAWSQVTCFRNAADLASEMESSNPSAPNVIAVIGRDRNCPEWFPYTPDRSPKEHLEKLEMIQLEHERKEHDLELARLHLDAEKQSQAIAAALKATTEATARFTTRWTYVAVAVAVVALVFVAANYFLPDLGRQIGHALLPNLTATPSPTVTATP